MNSRELSDAIAQELARAGVDRLFGMPGGGNNLNLIAAASDSGIPFVLAHHETSAAIMASVYGDLSDVPGVCVVTRGPGAANAANGVANAQLDRQALLLITDTVSAADTERIAHQRLDQRALFGPLTKWNATVGGFGDPAATTRQALRTAVNAPRGAVHLDFDPSADATAPAEASTSVSSMENDLQRAIDLAREARRPVFVLGVGARQSAAPLRAVLSATDAPVLSTYRAKGVIPDSWENYAGIMTGATTEGPVLEAADLIVLVGMDTVELIPNQWEYSAPVVSLASWAETSPYLQAEVEVVGDLAILIQRLGECLPETTWPSGFASDHRSTELATFYEAGRDEVATGAIAPQDVVASSRAIAPAGSIATVDAGAHMFPSTMLWEVENPDELLISSGLATMGFALPAAIAAGLARPGRRVVSFTGDGGLGMCIGELETLARLDLDVTVVVFNDATLSLIDIKAIRGDDPEKKSVKFTHTDFARVAEGYGLQAYTVRTGSELRTALESSFAHRGPSLIDVTVDPNGYPQVMNAVRGKR
ncbi:thiamine pyrophosphate-binding protein [Leucobacter sp. GX24907]